MTAMFSNVYHIAFLLSVLLTGVNSQRRQGRHRGSSTSGFDTQTEAAFDAAFRQLMNSSSFEEAIEKGILNMNGHTVRPEDLGAVVDNSTGKYMVSADSYDFGIPDQCSPREMSVPVTLVPSPTSRLFPTCVREMRCGGCCGAENVVCVPHYAERRMYSMLEVSYQGSGMTILGTRPVEVVRHLSCVCECGLSDEACGPLKDFNSDQCACTCKQTRRCSPPKMFSPETCGCVCAETIPCCLPGSPCILKFDENICQCDIDRQLVSNAANFTQEDVESYIQSQRAIMQSAQAVSNTNQAVPTSTTPELTTTTTTPPPSVSTTTESPTTTPVCFGIVCPPGFRLVTDECSCSLVSSRRRPGSRRRYSGRRRRH